MTRDDAREARLAAALRANLKRRKAIAPAGGPRDPAVAPSPDTATLPPPKPLTP